MKTYIVDIDGTLANLAHRLHYIQSDPKDWDAFFDACPADEPIQDVIDVVKAIAFLSYTTEDDTELCKIVYLTGRPHRVRHQTEEWLWDHALPKGELIMRRDGDHRPDTLTKRELLDKIIADGGVVAGVFEDRPSVCRVWREMGLTVFQMNHEEF